MLFPVINHFEGCSDCSTILGNVQLLESCNEPNILTGLFYSPDENYYSYPKTIEVVSQFKKQLAINPDDVNFNAYVYDASRITIDGAYVTNRPSNSQVASAYDTICPNAACSMIVFETSGEHRINEYNLQISSASCNNSLYSSNTFTELLETYGKSLAFRERYYECYFFCCNLIFAVGIDRKCQYYMFIILLDVFLFSGAIFEIQRDIQRGMQIHKNKQMSAKKEIEFKKLRHKEAKLMIYHL